MNRAEMSARLIYANPCRFELTITSLSVLLCWAKAFRCMLWRRNIVMNHIRHVKYVPGDDVPSHFNPAIVLGSYMASLCGCVLTVELLHRRGSGVFNLRSWFDTLLCATVLGLVGIWCMHFIGNRAIVLGSGEENIQLVYSPGFSTLSVFLPIIGLCIAFATAEYRFRSRALKWTALICTGIFAGLSVVGMHYMGNFGTLNYTLRYQARFLAASIVIAIGDCLLVLVLFYTLREQWISDWRKRTTCALFLAGGVSAMHFTASTHCIYRLEAYSDRKGIRSRTIQVAVAAALVGFTAVVIISLLVFTRHRTRVLRRSSQKVMLACAMFDPDGRILVTTEGVLPAREITTRFNSRTFDEDFDKAHPVFHWIFRVSRNWSCISELIPKMKRHIDINNANVNSNGNNSSSGAIFNADPSIDYSIVFRERFCVAAAALASSMNLPVEKIGVLYDNIVDTGTLRFDDRQGKRDTIFSDSSARDLESASEFKAFGRGQLLFLTRRLRAEDIDKLLNAGFKFGSMQQVGRNIAQNMQIPQATLETHLSSLKHYTESLYSRQKVGTWLSCFAMIPKPHSKGFDVAVKKAEQDELPDVQLLPGRPLQWQAEFLSRMHEKSMPQCIFFLENRECIDVDRTSQEQQFALIVSQAIEKLGEQLPSPWLQTARFHGSPLYAHYNQPFRRKSGVTTLYSFAICPDLHTSVESKPGLLRVPLSFFSIRHQCYTGSPSHLALTREIHKEFGPVLARARSRQIEKAKKSSINSSADMPGSGDQRFENKITHQLSISRMSTDDKTDASSEAYELTDKPVSIKDVGASPASPAAERDDFFGGILVNSETVVNSDSMSDFTSDAPYIGFGTTMQVDVGTSKAEETFVNELYAFTRASLPSKAGR